jgi:outer membrane usher protein
LAVGITLRYGARPSYAAEQQSDLQLDVLINGAPIHMIGAFVRFPGGMIGATRAELKSIGLRTDATRSTAGMVMLNEIPTLKYTYEERAQRIRITVDNAYRLPHVFDLSNGAGPVHPQAGWGMVLNYDLFSTFNIPLDSQPFAFNGTSLTLDLRAFSPFGTFEQSGIVDRYDNGGTNVVRLDTFYRFSDPGRMISWTAGDTVNGALLWTRPIRIGGMQAQRDFTLRPDLVTMPIANVGGTAEVPSTVDLYINSTRIFSQDVETGPFSLTNIPLVTGAGNAQMVIRDSSGHETATNVPFYGSANLLAPGLSSWSVEAGMPRLSYGSITDTYLAQPVASATWRQGLTNWFTAEGHAEGGSGVANGGLGMAARTGTFGVATAAIAVSKFAASTGAGGSLWGIGTGAQAAGSYETTILGIVVNVGSQRTFGDYEDLASATARQQNIIFAQTPVPTNSPLILPAVSVAQLNVYGNAHAPRALDRITVGGPLPFDAISSWSVSVIHETDASNNVSRLASVSYSRTLPFNTSVFAAAFKDFGTTGGVGILLGLAIPLGQTAAISSTVSSGQGGAVGTLDASQPLGAEYGSVGWQVQDSEGAVASRQGSLAYRSPFMTVQATATQSKSYSAATLEATGAIAAMAGDVFFSDRIDDAFAVVDAGGPGIDVSYENRPAGTSDSQGKVLVPTLRSYQTNRISIDPANLPVDAEIRSINQIVTPADRAGVLVPFKVQSDTTSALVSFVRADGHVVPAGSMAHLDGGGEFIVGYDGMAFIKGLAGSNHVTIDFGEGSCRASFAFKPQPKSQVRIGPVACR